MELCSSEFDELLLGGKARVLEPLFEAAPNVFAGKTLFLGPIHNIIVEYRNGRMVIFYGGKRILSDEVQKTVVFVRACYIQELRLKMLCERCA